MAEAAGEQLPEHADSVKKNPPPPLTLLTLPDVVKTHMLNQCDYQSMQSMRKTCSFFRTLIDNAPPDPKLFYIYACISRNRAELIVADRNLRGFPLLRVNYEQKEDGGYSKKIIFRDSIFEIKPAKKLPHNLSNLDAFYIDLEIVLRHHKICLKEFEVMLDNDSEEEFCNQFNRMMETRPPIKTKELRFMCVEAGRLLSILPHIDPEYVKKICLTGTMPAGNFNGILAMGLWRRATTMALSNLVITDLLQNIAHFEDFFVGIQSITANDMTQLRDMFRLHTTNLNVLTLNFNRRESNDNMTAALGQNFVHVPQSGDNSAYRIWYFRKAHKIFSITIYNFAARIKICEASEVHPGGIVMG